MTVGYSRPMRFDYPTHRLIVLFDQMPSFINPGAGLNQLDFSQDSDFIFDSIFTYHPDDTSQENGTSIASGPGSDTTELGPIVRLYGSDRDM